jgi:phosphoglucosamine mutase
MRADAVIDISHSHNPLEDNGIKIFDSEGFKLPEEKEAAIEELLFSESISLLHPAPRELGRATRLNDAGGRYIVFLKHSFPKNISIDGIRVALDCAHGATYKVAPDTFRELGADVTTLFNEPDGRNINVDCGSQYPQTLAKKVVERKAAVGFAFDGDGDRLIAVDEKGNILTGDQVLTICAASLKKEGRLVNNLVVRTVTSNMGMNLALRGIGIGSVMTEVGDRAVIKAMQAEGAVIGGEDSGHIIFLDHHTTGDGIITALQILAVMKKEGKPLSELAKIMKIFPQALINVEVRKRNNIETMPGIVRVVKDVEEKLGGEGRVLVRYSGTQNVCRVMVEGPTTELTEECCLRIAEVLKKEFKEQ